MAILGLFTLNAPIIYFSKSQWEKFNPEDPTSYISPFYIIYRAFFMIWFITAVVLCLSSGIDDAIYFLIYFTNINLSIQCFYGVFSMVHVVVGAVKTFMQRRKTASEGESLVANTKTTCSSIMAVVHTLLIYHALTFPFIVSIVYWGVLFDEQKKVRQRSIHKQAANHFQHTFNAVMALIDSVVIAVPVKLPHVIYIYAFLISYIFFTLIWEKSRAPLPPNSTGIYSFNWNDSPGLTCGIMCGVLAASTVSFILFCWGICRLRQLIAVKLNVGAYVPPSTGPDTNNNELEAEKTGNEKPLDSTDGVNDDSQAN